MARAEWVRFGFVSHTVNLAHANNMHCIRFRTSYRKSLSGTKTKSICTVSWTVVTTKTLIARYLPTYSLARGLERWVTINLPLYLLSGDKQSTLLVDCLCINLTAVHDVSCGTRGVLDQCAAAYRLCVTCSLHVRFGSG